MGFTEFIIFYIGTILVSRTFMQIFNFAVHKDFADRGYKLDMHKINEAEAEIFSLTREIRGFEYLIPAWNILAEIDKLIKYKASKSFVIDKLIDDGFLEAFSEKEKEEYAKKPTAINALFISAATSAKEAVWGKESENSIVFSDKVVIIFSENNVKNKIFLQLTGKGWTIVNAEGPISEVSSEERVKISESKFEETKGFLAYYPKDIIRKILYTDEFGLVFDLDEINKIEKPSPALPKLNLESTPKANTEEPERPGIGPRKLR